MTAIDRNIARRANAPFPGKPAIPGQQDENEDVFAVNTPDVDDDLDLTDGDQEILGQPEADNDDAVRAQSSRSRDWDAEVRDRAYFLWEEAGRPYGREHEFWARASDEIEGDRLAEQEAATRNRSIAR